MTWKIGFHGGPGGNHTGIGEYYRRLDEARIPFVIKSVDHYGHIYEATKYTRADHVRVFRLSTAGQGYIYDYDVPDYDKHPEDAAREHMEMTIATIESKVTEFDRSSVWLEVTNEIDRNRADWLGVFGTKCADIAIDNGYKLLMYGWASGEPEPEAWETEGSLDYLAMCHHYPDRIGVALHEYSYNPDDLFAGGGSLVGRFRALNDAAAAHNYNPPTIIITEFGYNDRSFPSGAMPELEEAARLYANYPNILGAAIWYLGEGFDNIHNETQPYIEPVTEAALSWASPPPPPPSDRGAPRVQYKRKYNVLDASLDPGRADSLSVALVREGETVGKSFDDAGIGDLDERIVKHHHSGANIAEFRAWYEAHYPGVVYTPVYHPKDDGPPPPPPGGGSARFGLHASTTGGTISEDEVALFSDSKIEHVKVLSSHSPETIGALRLALNDPPFLVRAFLAFGGRHVSPAQFCEWTLPDVLRSLDSIGSANHGAVVEIHNEPNLYDEGLSYSWDNGHGFNSWFIETVGIYRREVPSDVKLIFPGLSPGPDVPGVRADHDRFLSQCSRAIDAADGLGIHVYWSSLYPMFGHPNSGVTLLDRILSMTDKSKPVYITEASNNGEGSFDQKGREYVTFWNECKLRPRVQSVDYFVASDSGDFPREAWLGTGIEEVVGDR